MSDLNTAISGPMVQEYKSISSLKVNRVSIQPENKTSLELSAGNTSDVYFQFPSRPHSFLNGKNSYLTFQYKYNGTHQAGKAVQIASGCGQNFIKNVEVIMGSTSVELLQEYDGIASVIDDFQSQSRSQTLANILEDKQSSDVSYNRIKQGVVRSIDSTSADGYNLRRVSIPLMSLAVGQLQDKYMPMGQDFGLRLRITFNDPNVVLVATTGTTSAMAYKLEDITYEAEYLDSDAETYNAIVNESGGILKVSGTGISNFSTSLPESAGASTNTVLVPARYSSVRNYFTTMRLAGSVNSPLYNSSGSRTRANLESWVYRIHGKNYPQLPVVADEYNSSETMCEVLKCFHALHDTQTNCVFNAPQWVSNGYTTSGGTHTLTNDLDSSFLIGVEFEENSFSSSQLSGISTNSSNTFIEMRHSAGYPALVLNTYCFYDSIIEMNVATGEVMVSR